MVNNIPRLISWGVTNSCNLNCKHCYRDAGLPMQNELTTLEGKRLMEEVASLGGRLFILTGGEPLLRKDLFELAEYGTSLGLNMLLATNGTLIDREKAEKIRNSGFKAVAISLDGATSKTHDSFRGVRGAFHKAVEGAKNCVEAGLDVQINITVTRLNYNEVPAMLEIAEEIGAKYIHIFHFVPIGRGLTHFEMEVSINEYVKLLDYIFTRQGKVKALVKPTCAPQYWTYLLIHKPRFISEFLNKYPRGCIAGLNYAYISPNGDVTPCPYLPIVLGNLRSKSFRDIWLKSEVLSKLRERSNLKGSCKKCKYNIICGGCRARAFAYTGDYLAEDPACVFK